jgi:predicted GNAT family acetyltransferase
VTAIVEPVDSPPVTDNHAESRFETQREGLLCFLSYRRTGDRLVLIHAEVPPALERRGIGGQMVAAAVDNAERDALTIVPLCPFTRDWLNRHPDQASRVTVDWG